jgi:hypothetical protein
MVARINRKGALMQRKARALVVAAVTGVVLAAAGVAYAMQFGDWAAAQKIDTIAGSNSELNTVFLDGCPIQSPDGLSLYMASNRPNGMGGLDIWVASRPSTDAPWGAPVNLPGPINSAADDFCPTPVRGNGLFFVSRRVIAGVTCGQGDIYFTRRNPAHGWSEPEHLACAPAGPNSDLDEQGPSRVEIDGTEYLYFSRSSTSPAVAGDIFASENIAGSYGPAVAVAGLNDLTANDIQPNVRKDGLEVVFSSNRAVGAGGQDIWASTRESTGDPWSTPVNLGDAVNTAASESRPSLSWHAEQLLFGRAPGPEGSSDIYVTTREKLGGAGL